MDLNFVPFALVYVIIANAIAAFCVTFFLQVKVIKTIFQMSDHVHFFAGWKSLGKPNNPNENFSKFLAGDILPSLRKKWIKSWLYTIFSFALVFGLVIVFETTS